MKLLIPLVMSVLGPAAIAAEAPAPPADGAGAAAKQGADKDALSDPRLPPLIDQARQSYPEARKKFAAGLPRGDKFLIRARVRDAAGVVDVAVVRVRTIVEGVIKGSISAAPKKASGFAFGQALDVPEGEILDWIISRGDGSEEGDFMGHLFGKAQ